MKVRHCLLPLLALGMGCLRSPLPADAPAHTGVERPATRAQEPLEAVRLGGPGLRGLDLARLPERPLEPARPATPAEPLLAQAPPPREVVDKGHARSTDPAPAAVPARHEVAPAPPARKEEAEERRPFLRPALGEEAASKPATTARPGTPAPVEATTPPPASAPVLRDDPAPPPPSTPRTPPPRPQRQPEAEPEREILASAERPAVATPPDTPVRAAEVPVDTPRHTPQRIKEDEPAPVAISPSPAAEPLAALVPALPVLRTPGGGTEPAPVDEEEEARPPRPTAPPDARFQVQIMSASDPEGADDMRLQAELVFPDEVVEVVWDPPYYKVRVGAEATQEGAVELKRRALRLGFQNAWVVPRRQP